MIALANEASALTAPELHFSHDQDKTWNPPTLQASTGGAGVEEGGTVTRRKYKTWFQTGVRFHAFRRFRESVLLASDVRQILIDYWMGHENPDMSTRYGKQLVEDVNYRKQWAEKVGLGFKLTQVSKPELGVSCATCATNSVEQVCTATA